MAAINEDNRAAWQDIAQSLSAQRPSVGRHVEVIGGRKHIGKSGVVVRHQVSRYDDPFRYASEAQAHLREMAGRFGFVCLIRQEDGSTFWVDADYTKVVS